MSIPSDRQRLRQFAAEYEFRLFQEDAKYLIEKTACGNPRFEDWRKYSNFYISNCGNPLNREMATVTAFFGKRPIGYMMSGGGLLMEDGASLHYSFGFSGAVVISLYPAHSEFMRPREKMIHLHIGQLTAHQIGKRVQSDVTNLIAYAHVTSIDGNPTLREKARIWLLRKSKPTQTDDGFQDALLRKYIRIGTAYLPKAIITSFLGETFKVIAIALAVVVLVRLGFPEWAERFLPRK
jgi:hypothetical protein